MDWNSIWHGILSNGIYGLLILGGGIVIAVLKKRSSRWFGPTLWGLIGCGLVSVIVIAFVVITRIPKEQPHVTPENIESSVRTWLDTFGLSSKKMDDPNSYFALGVTLNNDTHLLVSRPKSQDRYIFLQSSITFGPEDKASLARMSDDDRDRFMDELTIEMNRVPIEYSLDSLNSILLLRRIPISDGLVESIFIGHINEIDSAKLLALKTIDLKLHHQNKIP